MKTQHGAAWGRVRTIKLSRAVKKLIDKWLEASGQEIKPGSWVFVPVGRAQQPVERQMTPQSIFNLVKKYGKAIGQADLAPHDLRRSHAKLAHRVSSPRIGSATFCAATISAVVLSLEGHGPKSQREDAEKDQEASYHPYQHSYPKFPPGFCDRQYE